MFVKAKRLHREAGDMILHLLLKKLEDRRAFHRQVAIRDEFIDSLVLFVVRVDLDERFAPVTPAGIFFFEPCDNVLGRRLRKARRKLGVLVNQCALEFKDVIHLLTPRLFFVFFGLSSTTSITSPTSLPE